jgi:hypothetical protein
MQKTIASNLKANLGDSDILKMACEEQIIALFTSYAKKSYIRLDAVDYFANGQKVSFKQHYAHTMKQITVDGVIDISKVKEAQQEGKIAPIVIKGVQWSIFSQDMRDEIRELFTEILLKPNDFEAIKAAYKVKLFRELTTAMESLVAGNRKPIEKFASRVRRSGKSGKCKHLQSVYPEFTDNFIFCLPLKRITK